MLHLKLALKLTFDSAAGFLVACKLGAPSQAYALPLCPLPPVITAPFPTSGAHPP